MLTIRTVLSLSALLAIPVVVACDDKPEPVEAGEKGEPEEVEPAVDEAPCDAEHFGEKRLCEGGTQFCASDEAWPSPTFFWGRCADEFVCEPGDEEQCRECVLGVDGEPMWQGTCDDDGGSSTPLVLSFDGAGVRFDSRAAAFDLGPQCGATDWVSAATPWLALDRDGSGAIEGGHELFGSATRMLDGRTAEHGFAALAELDRDRDGKISADDPDFARLLLWADHDGDRRSTGWELQPAADTGLVSIALTYSSDRRCDARNNCEVERAAFVYRDVAGRARTGEIVDVHLACQ